MRSRRGSNGPSPSISTRPLEDPHGHPIPSATGDLPQRNLQRLSEFRGGQRAVIREVQDDNPARLRHWQSLGFTPGAAVHILSYQPLDDMFEVSVGERLHRVGSEGPRRAPRRIDRRVNER